MAANVWTVKLSAGSKIPDELYRLGISILDNDSRVRIERFHFRADAERCLLGRLLPRLLLKHLYGVPPSETVFGRTSTGKPYIEHPRGLRNRVGFNVSHDGELVAMAFQLLEKNGPSTNAQGQSGHSAAASSDLDNTLSPGDTAPCDRPDVSDIGIDIMKIAFPSPDSEDHDLDSFIESVSDALTPLELYQLRSPSQTPCSTPASALTRLFSSPLTLRTGVDTSTSSTSESPFAPKRASSDIDGHNTSSNQIDENATDPLPRRLTHLYLLWTLKESYTKALGLGLGFDFKRLEYDCERDLFRVDKRKARGWEIGVGLVDVGQEQEGEADTEHGRGGGGRRVKYILAVSRRTRPSHLDSQQTEAELELGYDIEPETRIQVCSFKTIAFDAYTRSKLLEESIRNANANDEDNKDKDKDSVRTLEPSSSSLPAIPGSPSHPSPNLNPSPNPNPHANVNPSLPPSLFIHTHFDAETLIRLVSR